MSTIGTLLRATAVVVGSSAALAAGGLLSTAHADPAPPAPIPNIGEQLVNTAANAPQMLQSLATALGATPPAPPAPPPLASAAIRVPQPVPPTVPGTPAALPGATSAIPGATSAIPGATSAIPGATAAVPGITSAVPGATTGLPGFAPGVPAPVAGPATGPTQLLPSAQVNLPTMPFLPTPLPQQVSFPGDLASLAPGGVPIPHGATQPSTVVAPASSPNPLLLPLSGLP
jgi:hypothetical protein